MTSKAEVLATITPQKIENGWMLIMPREIAEAFGVPEGSIVTLFADPGKIVAQMNLAPQTSEARTREPVWLIDPPADLVKTVGLAGGSAIAVHARSGSLHTEILPPLSPDLDQIVQEIIEEDKDLFEELKRLGD